MPDLDPGNYNPEEEARLVSIIDENESRRQEFASSMHDMVVSDQAWGVETHTKFAELQRKHDYFEDQKKRSASSLEVLRGRKRKTDAELKAISDSPLMRWLKAGLDEHHGKLSQLTPEERDHQKDLRAEWGSHSDTPGAKFFVDMDVAREGIENILSNIPKEFGPQNATRTPNESGDSAVTPIEFRSDIMYGLGDYGGAMSMVKTIQTDHGNEIKWPVYTEDDSQANQQAQGKSAQGAAQLEKTMASFTERNIPVYVYNTGYIPISRLFWEDVSFNPDEWVRNALLRRIGKILETVVATGSGTNLPLGLLTGAKEFESVHAQNAFLWEDFLEFELAVPDAYLSGMEPGMYGYKGTPGKVGYITSRHFMTAIKKLKDSENRPIYLTSISDGGRPLIFGREVAVMHEFPAVDKVSKLAAIGGKKPILFGNFDYHCARFAGRSLMIEQFYDSQTASTNSYWYLGTCRFGANTLGVVTSNKTEAYQLAKVRTAAPA